MVRESKARAKAALLAAKNAGPALAAVEAKEKKVQKVTVEDQDHLGWTKKMAAAEAELAAKEVQVAQTSVAVAKNRTLNSVELSQADDSLREKAAADADLANTLVDATAKLVQNNDSVIVRAAEQASADQTAKHSAQVQTASAESQNQLASVEKLQHQYDSSNAQSEMSLRAAGDAAANFGKADTAERIALEKLKALLPSEEAQQADETAANARAAVDARTHTATRQDADQALWAKQNAQELLRARGGGSPAESHNDVLGETEAVTAHSETNQMNLATTLHKAILAMDTMSAEDAIDAANSIQPRILNDKDGVMLKLEKTLSDTTNGHY
jgi:hypothetical protein